MLHQDVQGGKKAATIGVGSPGMVVAEQVMHLGLNNGIKKKMKKIKSTVLEARK